MSISVIKILIEWSINSKEYELLYNIYNILDIGIPNVLIYKLPTNSYFSSIESFRKRNNTRVFNDIFLQKLTYLFKNESRFKKLKYWDNKYGYERIEY
jgi:hypothetical protein